MAIQVPRHSTRTVAATLNSNRSDVGRILPHSGSHRWALQRRLGKARLLDGNSAAPTQLAQQNTELLPLVGCCFGRSAESTERTNGTQPIQIRVFTSDRKQSGREELTAEQAHGVRCV